MPKVGRGIRDALQALREYENAQAPQKGMFSTMDELIQSAPFARGSPEQWRGYLKPGRMLKRGETQFPLKQEELEYTGVLDTLGALESGTEDQIANLRRMLNYDAMEKELNPSSITREELAELTRRFRPEFALELRSSDYGDVPAEKIMDRYGDASAPQGLRRLRLKHPTYGPPGTSGDPNARLSHGQYDTPYIESVTQMPGFTFRQGQHFSHDAISHSRATSHDVPELGRVHLVEEIQSDPHEAAAERVAPQIDPRYNENDAWIDYMTPEERAEYDEITEIMDDGGSIDPDAHEAAADREAALYHTVVNRLNRTAPRRGYFSRLERDEMRGLERQKLDRGPRSLSAEDDERLAELYEMSRDRVPDAPFKDPSEYGRLELRKQLLDAVESDQDYLALTRGEDQIERYGMTGYTNPDGYQPESPKAEGMRYIYDKIYRGELEKLARQYGAEIVDIEVPIGRVEDLRPDVMQRSQIETTDELHEYLNGNMMYGGLDEIMADTSYITTTMEDVEDIIRMTEVPQDQAEQIRENINKVLRSVGITEHVLHNVSSPMTNASPISDENKALWESTMGWLTNHLNGWMGKKPKSEPSRKSFPAIRLTPEVKERIRQTGAPLWSVGAGATGLGLSQMEDGEEPAEFAKGGSIRDTVRALKKSADRLYRGADEDQLEALVSHHLDRPLSVRDLRAIKALFDQPDARMPVPTTLYRGDTDKGLIARARHRDPIPTSLDRDVAAKFVDDRERGVASGEMSEIHAPAGARGIYIPGLVGDAGTEKEVLLPAHSKFSEIGENEDVMRLLRLYDQLENGNLSDKQYDAVEAEIETLMDAGVSTLDPHRVYRMKKAEGGEVEEERDPRYLDRALTSLKNLWSSIDPYTGDVVLSPLAGGFDEAGNFDAFRRAKALPSMPSEPIPAPGIALDTYSLPYQFGLSDSEGMGDALARLQEIEGENMARAGLDEPQGFLENTAHAAGTMLGQIPIPASGAFKMPRALARLTRMVPGVVRKALGAVPEFLGPTVRPGMDYVSGALGGGALNEYGDDAVNAARDASNAVISWVKGEAPEPDLPDELKLAILEHLAEMDDQR